MGNMGKRWERRIQQPWSSLLTCVTRGSLANDTHQHMARLQIPHRVLEVLGRLGNGML
jgi:hypothetical protein